MEKGLLFMTNQLTIGKIPNKKNIDLAQKFDFVSFDVEKKL